MSDPDKVATSPPPLAAGLKPPLFYKCLLQRYAQKLRKHPPIYLTHNEGFEHPPKFRSTVWIDGVSYTSSNTFQRRKIAEMDVSKIAFFAVMQKLKNEASHLIREDKTLCKSIMLNYAAKMKIEKPTYRTIQLDAPVPVFRSSLVFDGATYTGNCGETKKEAEQVAACAAILKCLDSESGNVMSEIITCQLRHHAKMKKTREEIYNFYNGDNAVGIHTGLDNGIALDEARAETGTSNKPNTSTTPESCLLQGTTIPATCLSPGLTQLPIAEVPSQAITPVIPVHTVLAQTPFTGTNNSPTSSAISAPCLGRFASIPATHLLLNMIQPEKSEASSGTAAPLLPSVSLSFGRKRNRKNKKNAQKKMRYDAQLAKQVWDENLVEARAVEPGANNMPNTSAIPEPCLVQGTTIPAICLSPGVTQPPIPDVSTQAITPVISVPTALAQTPFVGTNNLPISSSISAPCLGQSACIPATQRSSCIIQPENTEASSGTVAPLLPSGVFNIWEEAKPQKQEGSKQNAY